jgi:Histidine kinase
VSAAPTPGDSDRDVAERRDIKRILVAFAIGVALLDVPPIVAALIFEHAKPPLNLSGLVFPVILLLFVAPTVSVARRWGQRRGIGTPLLILVFCALSGLVVAALGAAYHAITLVLPGVEEFGKGLGLARIVLDGLTGGPFAASIWAFVYEMPRAIEQARERERARQELQREAERARVRATLEPHFVLNTLNAIAGLVGDEPETARQLVGDLGDLLRDAVRLAERATHTAADEFAWLGRYARVLEARHRGRLEVRFELDADARDLELPVLLLQPLVENAIRHGALQRAGGGVVTVRASRGAVGLRCTVEDDGPGMHAQTRDGATGLALTRRRLEAETEGSTMTIDTGPRGTRIVLDIGGAR